MNLNIFYKISNLLQITEIKKLVANNGNKKIRDGYYKQKCFLYVLFDLGSKI